MGGRRYLAYMVSNPFSTPTPKNQQVTDLRSEVDHRGYTTQARHPGTLVIDLLTVETINLTCLYVLSAVEVDH